MKRLQGLVQLMRGGEEFTFGRAAWWAGRGRRRSAHHTLLIRLVQHAHHRC